MRKGLGRGMEALFSDDSITSEEKEVSTLKLSVIEPNKNQPRKDFNKEKIEALSNSIKEHGIIQPLVVVKNKNNRYTIVAGERRWRAAKNLGLDEVPVIIKNYTNEEIAQIALIENLQRENLNPIEEALGYQTLLNEFEMTQEAIGIKIGKSRSAIANTLRLLSLDDEIKSYLVEGTLTGGHARALLSLDKKEQRTELAKKIIENNLNVRQAENLAKQMQTAKKPKAKKAVTQADIELVNICNQLSSKLGTKVNMTYGKKKNKIEIEYYNDDDLIRIIDILNK